MNKRKKASSTKTSRKLIQDQAYAKMGENPTLFIDPPVVHFAGFHLPAQSSPPQSKQPSPQEIVVRVVNKSTKPTRMHIFYPDSPYFRASCDKKGTIPPGMSEDIRIAFYPQAYQYYYDCIKIHHEDGNLLLPMHGYPVMNELIDFPAQLDFGRQPLGERVEKNIRLACSVPIEFEFKITSTLNDDKESCSRQEDTALHQLVSADFDIAPTQGIIPAHGHRDITVSFCPVKMASVSISIQLLLSQFGFQPLRCRITGSSAPGVVVRLPPVIEKPKRLEDLDQERETRELDIQLPRIGRPGIVHDPLSKNTHVKSSKMKTPGNPSSCKDNREENSHEEMVDGLKVPKVIDGIVGTNFMLTQQSGKLKPKDLKAAIENQRQIRAQEKQALRNSQEGSRAIGADVNDGTTTTGVPFQTILMEEVSARAQVGSSSITSSSRQLKELAFVQDLNEIAHHEQQLEFESQRDHLGDQVMTGEEIQLVKLVRENVNEARARVWRQDQRRCLRTKDDDDDLVPHVNLDVASELMTRQVDFNVYQNTNLWTKRKRVVARFIQIVSTVIVQLRMIKRLRCIQARLGNARTRAQVAELVSLDWAGGDRTTSDQSSSAAVKDYNTTTTAIVERLTFPLAIEAEETKRMPFATNISSSFVDFKPFALKIPTESELVRYSEFAMPAIACHVPLESNRALQQGAEEEQSIRNPRQLVDHDHHDHDDARARASRNDSKSQSEIGDIVIPQVDEKTTMSTKMSPSHSMKLSSKYRLFQALQCACEAEPEYILQPMVFHRDAPRTYGQILVGQDAMGTLSLSSVMLRPPHSRLTMCSERWLSCFSRNTQVSQYLCPDDANLGDDSGSTANVWKINVPPFIVSKEMIEQDELSESESDNEEENRIHVPTISAARALFMNEETLGDDEKENVTLSEDSASNPEVLVQFHSATSFFQRYSHLMEMEQQYNQQRKEWRELLPEKINDRAQNIQDVQYQFGKTIPCHLHEEQ